MVSSTRIKLMIEYDLASDPVDNQIIHCQNALQFLACIISIAGSAIGVDSETQDIIDIITNVIFLHVKPD